MATLKTTPLGNGLNDIDKLQLKAKTGWRNYFVMKDEFDELSEFMRGFKTHNKSHIDDMKKAGEKTDNVYEFLFRQLYEKMSEKVRCYNCEERLVKTNMDIYRGRMICKGCRADFVKPPNTGCGI